MWIPPFGTMLTDPSNCRIAVVRMLSASTVPETVATSVVRSTISPTSNCPSTKMNKPLIVSRTRVWAPNPSAIPAIPADAISGAMFTLTAASNRSTNTNHATMMIVPDRIPTTVVTRRRRRPSASSSVFFERCWTAFRHRRDTTVTTRGMSRLIPSAHP